MVEVDQSLKEPGLSITDPATAEAEGSLRGHLRAVIALAGTLRPTGLAGSIGRSLLDLPIAPDRSVLAHWQEQIGELRQRLGVGPLAFRLMVNPGGVRPKTAIVPGAPDPLIQEDRGPYRGTGGVLRDLAGDYASEDLIAVINGPQIMLRPLAEILLRLAALRAGVAIASHDDGTPSGLLLLRPSALMLIPEAGFIDLKEQALPQIAHRHPVGVVRWSNPVGLPIRTLQDYIQAVRRYHQARAGTIGPLDAFSEQWRTTFSIVEPGATVHPTARVHDAVVLAGGRVERDAVVVQSVVAPGGVVRAGRMATDRVVEATSRARRENGP